MENYRPQRAENIMGIGSSRSKAENPSRTALPKGVVHACDGHNRRQCHSGRNMYFPPALSLGLFASC